MLEFRILMIFLCVLTGEGKEKKDSRGGLGLGLGLSLKNELSGWYCVGTSLGSLEAQPMPRREANASSLIRYLSSTAFPSHQGRRPFLVTVATARSPSQLCYCSPSRDAAVRKDRPRQTPSSSFLLRCSGFRESKGRRHKDERSVSWGLPVRTFDGILAGRWSHCT